MSERPAFTVGHITDGESVAGTLRKAALPGKVYVYGDLMYEGPIPAGLSQRDWHEARARFLAEGGEQSFDEVSHDLRTFERALEDAARHDETVLWLDHRLSNQLTLIRLLSWFGRRREGGKPSMIAVGHALGPLTADQLRPLADTRREVTPQQFRLGRAAWLAFTSPDPSAMKRVIGGDTSALPYLAAALRRHLEEFPSVENGLSRTERQALAALREHGPLRAVRMFVAVQKLEEAPFMGDTSFFRILNALASARVPLIEGGDALSITPAGLRVLEGRDDHVRLNGIDRWLGGVHLKGVEAAWRWDAARGKLAATV